jgi:hypothetical protein
MFSKAYEIASKFTHPVIVSMRFFDKTVESGLGSFIILNDEGWMQLLLISLTWICSTTAR